MDTEGEVDIAKVQRDVVDPVLARMLKPGELERVNLKRGRYDHAPRSDENYDELIVNLVVAGEMFGTAILYAEDDRGDLEAMRDRLVDHWQDFIAESSFGWGELRQP